MENTFRELAPQALTLNIILPKWVISDNIVNLRGIKPINEVHSENPVNSDNSGSDKVNANVVRLYVVVGV